MVAWAARELRRRLAMAAKGKGKAALSIAEIKRLFSIQDGTIRRVLRDSLDCEKVQPPVQTSKHDHTCQRLEHKDSY